MIHCFVSLVFAFFLGPTESFAPPPLLATHHHHQLSNVVPCFLSSTNEEERNEALKSLIDFHEGSWRGTARSFTVTPDVAAGIVQRKSVDEYQTLVTVGRKGTSSEFYLMESIRQGGNDNDCKRTLSLTDTHMDIDSVDGSYSLDVALPDFPSFLSGTEKLPQFLIEHCIATSNNRRARCFALYGVDSGSLIRVVVCEEERQPQENIMEEMESDVDRIVNRIAGQMQDKASSSSQNNETNVSGSDLSQESRLKELGSRLSAAAVEMEDQLSPHPVSLMELSSGVWLGDAIIRDIPMVPDSPFDRQSGQGFGKSDTSLSSKGDRIPFASWSVGVQKVAWRLMWNFGDEIRQVNDFGKAMGAELAPALTRDLAGTVCINEGLSRRIPVDERMVYIDWNEDNVGFIIGSHSIQLPRYLNFDNTRRVRPFYSEFCTYQKAESQASSENKLNDDGMGDNIALPEVVCSKISRVYNYKGLLKQGCTSFFTLKRFGTEA